MRQSKNEIKKILEFSSVFFIFERFGLATTNSKMFQEIVYEKAKEDLKYWYVSAPHGLKGDLNEHRKS